MRFFKIGRMLTIVLLLAMSIMVLTEQFSEQAAVVWAEVMPFTGAGVSVQGTHGGTGEIAKEGAKMSAIQAAQDQAGIYVSSLSVMKNSSLSQDEIATIVSDVVRVDEKNIKYETSILGDSDVQVVKYRASVTVYIDTDSLKKNIDTWRQKDEKKRQILVNANEDNRKSIEDLNRKVSDTETMIKQGADKTGIQAKLMEIERKTLAMKKEQEARELSKQGNLQEAIKLYSEAIQIKPDFAQSYSNRGFAYLRLGNNQQAIADCTKAIELDPTFVKNAYINRGRAYSALGKKQEAIADYNKAIELNPKSAYAYLNRGRVYSDLGNHRQAIADYSKAIELEPKYANAYGNRGFAYFCLGNHQQAIADNTKAIELNPKEVYAYVNRGRAYFALGNKEQAIADYNKAIEIEPKFGYAYFHRGSAYSSLGNHQQVIADCSKAIELNPKRVFAYNIFAYNIRGIAHYYLGNYQQAIVDYSKAIELNPKFASAYYNRGLCYKKLGNIAMANADFAKARELGYKA